MKQLFKYLKPYMFWTIIAPLFMFGEVVMDLLQPTLMKNIIDVGVQNNDSQYIIRTGLLMIGCALVGMIGGAGNAYFTTKAGYGFARDLRAAVYHKIQQFSFANIDKFQTGSLVTRTTNDITQIMNAFTSCIRGLTRSPFLCIGGVLAVLAINKKLSLIVLAVLPLLVIIVVLVMKNAHPLFMKVQQKIDRINIVMQENLAGVRVIKAFGRSNHEKKRFSDANEDLADTNMRAMYLMSIMFPMVNLIMNAAMIALYYFGGKFVFAGTMQAGEIMAFSSYIMQILMSLIGASFTFLFLSRAGVSIERVNEVLNTELDIADGSNDSLKVTDGRVEFSNVSFRYPGQGGDPVLQDINFVAESGETVAILGATGSGKTSLVSLIQRLYDVSGGSVIVDGHDVREYTLKSLRGGIGMALQQSILFTGDIAENLRWGDDEASSELVQKAARVAQAESFIDALPDGYETELGQRGVNLSGGQKQRLSIARALVRQPSILILDDSTSAVDLATEAEIQRELRDVMGHMTVFIIAQRINSVMDADKILVMENGRIVDMGKHDELKHRCSVYREIVVSQLGEEAL